ncbi:TIR motif-containing protein [Sarcoptes scabiei]|uniref:TIR motif-containing protein n=1 Tax=Sarcoptes scabiei TaxID=52283 RepID=A0A132AJ20_SARSC|nr:TIR motif-containing protein [Sarcoptes scabiei]
MSINDSIYQDHHHHHNHHHRNQLQRNNSLIVSDSIPNEIDQPKETVIGIVFVQESTPSVPINFDNRFDNGPISPYSMHEISLGTIILSDRNGSITTTAFAIRLAIQKSLFNMDDDYVFLTKFGSPISIDQETYIELNHLVDCHNLIRFRRKLGPNRCSLIGYYSNNCGIFLGHIFVHYESNLKTARTIIDENLKDIKINNYKIGTNYYFLYSTGCIINPNNEQNMILIEIIRNNSVGIRLEKPFDIESSYYTESNRQIADCSAVNNEDQNDSLILRNKVPKILFRRKTSKRRTTIKIPQKQIMLSYVRREAAEHAIQLKKTLIDSGFSVYLDVHEIQMGSDWQDSLNCAVQNCHFFVPLITQNYGRTQWTNREVCEFDQPVKLADVLQKHIIPINFLDLWPPECLAIQFATTQYIPWNPKSSEHNPEENDSIEECASKLWAQDSIEHVTKLITERIYKLSQTKISPFSNTKESQEIIEKKAAHLQSASITLASSSSSSSPSSPTAKQRSLIVISAHPDQSHASDQIRSYLLNDYDVWCSSDLTSNLVKNDTKMFRTHAPKISSPSYEIDFYPITENHSTITRPVQDYARYIVENSKKRPKSVPNPDKLEIRKKDLTRVFSYGDSPYFSSISPDKMDRLQCFHRKVLQSSLVIILASDQYYRSSTSEQHVYYCGQRVKTILVQFDETPAPVWFLKLMSNNDNPLNYESKTFKEDLMDRINRTLDPHCKEMENLHEIKIKYLADCMKKNIPNPETCVYVFGSTEVSNLDPKTAQICIEIGRELAKFKNINLITNGYYGTGDIVAHTFYQEISSKQENSVESIIHIVPLKDNEKTSDAVEKNNDGTFKKVSYGQTLFLGESLKERDSVIARMIDTSILIGGDQNAARETEEMIWNDHYVIPIKSTGGAAGGEFDVPSKIFSCPNGVRENQWSILLESNATPVQIAKAVINVIYDLKKAIHKHTISTSLSNLRRSFNEQPIKKRIANRKKLQTSTSSSTTATSSLTLNDNFQSKQYDENKVERSNSDSTENSAEKILPTFKSLDQSFAENLLIASDHNPNYKISGFKGKFNKFLKRFTNKL